MIHDTQSAQISQKQDIYTQVSRTDVVCVSCKQTNFKTILKSILNRPYQTKFLESLVKMSGSSHTTTNNRKLLCPSEIHKPIIMEENIIKVLGNTFLNPFNNELDAAKLYNIVSGQLLHDSMKDSLLSREKAGKQLMFEYVERMSTETYSEITMMDNIDQYKNEKLYSI